MTRRTALALLALPLLLTLTACDPGATPDGSPSNSPSVTPSAGDELGAPLEVTVPDDATIVVQGTVSADNGSTMDVALVVHSPTNWNSPAAPDRPLLMTEECAGALDAGVYEAQGWNFVRVDVVARLREGSEPWPADAAPITLAPSAEFVAVASDEFPGEDADVPGDTPHCDRDRLITGPGEGAMVIGLADDIHLEDTASNGIRWASHGYGFTVPPGALTVSDCSVRPTDLAALTGWPASGYGEEVSGAGCRYGVVTGEPVDS